MRNREDILAHARQDPRDIHLARGPVALVQVLDIMRQDVRDLVAELDTRPGGWIACADQLPKQGQLVLVPTGSGIDGAQYDGNHEGRPFILGGDGRGGIYCCNPTHWMPEPTRPRVTPPIR